MPNGVILKTEPNEVSIIDVNLKKSLTIEGSRLKFGTCTVYMGYFTL